MAAKQQSVDSPLLLAGQQTQGYDGIPTTEDASKKMSISLSVISERRLSTARFMGIMIPKDFWNIVQCAIFSCSMSMSAVIANRKLFGNYKFPLLIAQLCQCFGAVFLSFFMGVVSRYICPRKENGDPMWPKFTYNFRLALTVLPLTLCVIPRILCTNGALGATQVSTYQVTRQSAMLFSCLFSMYLLNYRPSKAVLGSLALIVAGIVVVGLDPTSLSFAGLMWGLGAAISSAAYLTMVKYFLPYVNGESAQLVNYNVATSIPILIVLIFVFGEHKQIQMFLPWSPDPLNPMPCSYLTLGLTLSVSVVCGFLINIASMLLVKVSSPVTYDVVGTGKGILQCLYGIVFMNDTTTMSNLFGIALSIVGSFTYGKAKQSEHVAKVRSDAIEKKRQSYENRQKLKEDAMERGSLKDVPISK